MFFSYSIEHENGGVLQHDKGFSMAKIVLGMGTSHSPMLLATDEELEILVKRDHADMLPFRDENGNRITYAQVLAKADPAIAEKATHERMLERAEQCRVATQRLRDELVHSNLDALVIIGDDQDELLKSENRPSVAIYHGDVCLNALPPGMEGMPEWLVNIRSRFYADPPKEYPNAKGLAEHIISHMIENDFDIGSSDGYPGHGGGGEGHAFAYIHSRIMDQDNPIPVVPVLLNTFYAPNKVTPRRAYMVGQGIRAAIEAFPEDMRVGVIASGGLSHFMVDEVLDDQIMKALKSGDRDELLSLPRDNYIDGTSEILNWICVAGALEGHDVDWIEYVPGYRSPAGTGVGLAFGKWK